MQLTVNGIIESKKGGKDQELIQSSTPPDPGYHMVLSQDIMNEKVVTKCFQYNEVFFFMYFMNECNGYEF